MNYDELYADEGPIVTNDFQFAKELALAELAARRAGSAVMGMFKGKYDVRDKSKNNPVTSADLEANRIIREHIQESFPNDGWLSEEDADDPKRLNESRVWVVDPIDGTKEFIEGVPQFAVSIGFVVDGRPQVAIVFNPAEGEFYRAAAGQGAFLNDKAIHVTQRENIDGATLLVSRSEPQKRFQVFVDRCVIAPVGSIAYRLARIGGGYGDGTLTFRNIHEWDICAGVLIVEEAGGKVVDGDGKSLMFNRLPARHKGVVAANPELSGSLQGLWAAAVAERR
jgi:myo-inositol-1(or 4)-monophosphatase